MKNQENMTHPKEENKFSVTNLKEMEVFKLANKNVKIIIF